MEGTRVVVSIRCIACVDGCCVQDSAVDVGSSNHAVSQLGAHSREELIRQLNEGLDAGA